LVEFDKIILIGSLAENKKNIGNIEGKMVRIKKCGFIDKKIYYQFEIVNN
jgi:hypothetical protein